MTSSSPTSFAGAIRSRVLEIPSWILLIEIFIGAGWLRAGTEKVISPAWWSGESLAAFLNETDEARVPWFHVVTDSIVAPNLVLVAAGVAATQLLVGATLITGRARVPALLVGVGMNVSFVLAGAVTPSAFYLLAQLAVLLWAVEARQTARPRRLASAIAVGGLALAGSAVLSISTLHPEHVIEDPSMMLVFLGGLAALGAERAAMAPSPAPAPTVDDASVLVP